MDQSIRNKLRGVVTQCRKLLEEAVSQVLQGQFGISTSGKKDEVQVEDESSLKLSPEDQQCRHDLVAHLEHIQALGYKAKDALAQLVREIAFTHLNRLCAYKMMEAREVWVGGQRFRECVTRGIKSQGFQFYLADDQHGEDKKLFDAGQQDVAYRHFLRWLGALLSEEIGVLFSPTDPANRLFPPQRTLDDVLALLNSDDLAGIWTEDETIGWVYQYFTPKELRDQVRKESAAPRNSYELAFRNQFFTPRYVVEFLTDNTLGRIWYEMRKGNTRLKEQCRYMVRRPSEVFLAEGQSPPEPTQNQEELSQEELLKQPVHIPHRPKKDPRELRILDPACGSGHFLLYCFDLLLTIYEEAYDDPDLSPKLREDYPTLEALRRDVPRLILAHNLHGIDIDLRASQIAALALWLRCQRAFRELGLKQERPKITKSNFVCAEPMPGESEMLKEFVADLQPKVLGHLVEVVFDKMKLAGEAGSLLKIEEELRDAITQVKTQWVAEYERAKDRKGRPMLFSQGEMDRASKKNPQPQLFDFSEITNEQFWDEAESQVLIALQGYVTHASNGIALQRRLFADDAERGFAFIDLCQKRFDVILMNPPFGEVSLPAREHLYAVLPESSRDICAAFMTRCSGLLSDHGRSGAITNRLIFFNEFLATWRERMLLGGVTSLVGAADLGYGVLDAVVETAAHVVENGPAKTCYFINLLSDSGKESALCDSIKAVQLGSEESDKATFHVTERFRNLPANRFSYDIGKRWLTLLTPKAKHSLFVGKGGICTGDDFHFYRLFWELPRASLGSTDWRWLAKGGEFSRYRCDTHLMIDWKNEPLLLRTKNSDRYGQRGATYTYRTTSNLSARVLNDGVCFSQGGPAILPDSADNAAFVLALMNSFVATYCLETIVGGGDSSVRGTAARNLEPRYLEFVPDIQVRQKDREWFDLQVESLLQCLDVLDDYETDALFQCVMQLEGSSWKAISQQRAKQAFQSIKVAYEIVVMLEQRIASMFGLDRQSVQETFSTTGWPWLMNGDVKEIPEHILDAIEPLPRDEPHIVLERKTDHRFLNKLSHYLHADVEAVAHHYGVHPITIADAMLLRGNPSQRLVDATCRDVLSLLIGCLVGRWDFRRLVGSRTHRRQKAFESLPRSSPAMLQDEDCLPSSIIPEGYPIAIDLDGIVPDDPDHSDDIVRRLQEALELIWKDRAEAIEQEACEVLGVKELRDYFRKPGKGGFWDDHVSRYSRSRRKAPIYWYLKSKDKNYGLWLYYHRLDKDILFKARQNYVEPKIRLEQTRLDSMRSQKSALDANVKSAKKIDKDIEKQEGFLDELKDFSEKLERAAKLNFGNSEKLNSNVVYDPDLNDGVVLNIAPLWELVPWKEASNYWEELLEGQYEWSSMGKLLRAKGLVK